MATTAINSNFTTQDIASMQAISDDNYKSVIVRDMDRGGYFVYKTGSYTPDDGIVFEATGIGVGYWVRQVETNRILVEWWGDLQTALDYISNTDNSGYVLTSKSEFIEINDRINVSVKNYGIDLQSTIIKPSATFISNIGTEDTMIYVIGDFEPEEEASAYFKWKIDGLQTLGIVGMRITNKLIANSHEIYVRGCEVGVHSFSRNEKQTMHVNGQTCTTLIKNEADTGGAGDVTPDENVFYVTGERCITYFHDLNGSISSSNIHFNCENSTTGGYDVIIEGSEGKTVSLSGEIRGSNGGSVYVDSSCSVVFNGLFSIGCSNTGGACVYIKRAFHVTGHLQMINVLQGEGLFISKLERGGFLNANINSVSNGKSLVLGDDSVSDRVDNLEMNVNSFPNSSAETYDIEVDSARDCVLNVINLSKGISFTGTIVGGGIKVSLPNKVVLSDLPVFVAPGTSVDRVLVNVVGRLSSSQIEAYSYPYSGMMCERVVNAGGLKAIYTTIWLYEYYNWLSSQPYSGSYSDGTNTITVVRGVITSVT